LISKNRETVHELSVEQTPLLWQRFSHRNKGNRRLPMPGFFATQSLLRRRQNP